MYYNPLDKFYKSIIGAISTKEKLMFRVKGNFDSVLLLVKKDGDNEDKRMVMHKVNDCFETEISLEVGLYFYCFELPFGEFIGLGADYFGIKTYHPERFQLTVYSDDYVVPEWLNGGLIYQIFPDRFNFSGEVKKIKKGKILHDNWLDTPIFLPNEKGEVVNNDFFGGDIKGIINRLDYLNELGVTAIYLNPIFEAFSNHRYDTGDYMQIDPLLGTEDDLINLIKKAGERNIKIILDGVFNHTGDDSLYFNKYGNYNEIGAYQSNKSKYYNWYTFTDYPNKYEAWWGIKTLPAVDENNADYINFITGKDGVLEHYTKLGIGGWRLDVVDELPGNFVKKIRSAVKGINSSAIVIGEVWENAANKISYGVRREYFQGKELDSVMNYPLKNAIFQFVKYGNVKCLSGTIKEQLDHYPKSVVHSLMNLLSTHDTARLLTVVGDEEFHGLTKTQMSKMSIADDKKEEAKFKLKAATLLQYTLCGVPSVYYGDEIGMEGCVDPLNRKCYPWGCEDKEILEWYKILGKIRRSYSAFATGDFEEVFASDGVFIYKRIDAFSEILICINVSKKDYSITYDDSLFDLLTTKSYKEEFLLIGKSLAVLVKKL